MPAASSIEMASRWRLVAAIALMASASGCGGGPAFQEVVPTLPGDGDAHTAKPGDMPPVADDTPDDPWAERDDLIQAPPPKPARAIELPAVKRFTLPNGLQVIAVPDDRLPVVDMRLAIKVGSEDSPRDKMGVERFTAAMLSKGTRTRNALQIAEYVDRVGARLTADANLEATVVDCSSLARHVSKCATILADVVVNPVFPTSEMDIVRKQLLAVVQQRKDNAGAMAGAHLHNLLWGDEHVRGWPMSTATVQAIERKDLRRWHQRHYAPNNAVLVVSGAVDPTALQKQLRRSFRWWQKRKLPARNTHPTPTLMGSRVRLVDKPGQTQAHIRIGQLGIAHRDPAFFDHIVFNYVLGGGVFSSRLMKVVRSQAGNTYSVSSAFERSRERGTFVVSTFTRSEATMATLELILREMDRMNKQGPSDAELASAIAYLSGSYQTRFQSAASFGHALLAAEMHDLGQEYVRDYPLAVAKVTRESAGKAAGKAIDLQKLAIVVVGDAKLIEPQLQKVGWQYEKVDYRQPVARHERNTAVAGAGDAKSQAAARAVIEAAVKAKGGAAKLRAINTMTVQASGQIAAQGRTMPAKFTRRLVRPDRLRVDIDVQIGGGQQASLVTALDRDKAWAQPPNQPATALPPEAVTQYRRQLWRDHEFVLLHALEPGAALALLPEQKDGGTTYDVVSATSADGQVTVELHLDRKTRMLHRLRYTEQGFTGNEEYGDYRKVAGIHIAHRRKTEGPDATYELRVESVSFDAAVADELFALPK